MTIKEKEVRFPRYKVLVKGTMVEYTDRFKDAEDAFKFSDGQKEIFQIERDGSAKLIKQELHKSVKV